MPKLRMHMSKSQISNPWWKYNFDIEVKGQGHTEFMNVCDTSYHSDTLMCQQRMTMLKDKEAETMS